MNTHPISNCWKPSRSVKSTNESSSACQSSKPRDAHPHLEGPLDLDGARARHASVDPELLNDSPGLETIGGELHRYFPRYLVLTGNNLPFVHADLHAAFSELFTGKLCRLRYSIDHVVWLAPSLNGGIIDYHRKVDAGPHTVHLVVDVHGETLYDANREATPGNDASVGLDDVAHVGAELYRAPSTVTLEQHRHSASRKSVSTR